MRSRHATKFPLESPPRGVVASDAALLRFPPDIGIEFPYLCVVKHPSIETGHKLMALGFPLGFDLSIRPGVVTSISAPNGLIQTNLGLARGMSGGPVLDDKLNVVGIVHGGIENQSSFDFFTRVNLALPLFEVPPAAYAGDSCSAAQRTSARPTTIERSYQISETLDEHPNVAPTSRAYVIRKNADPGHIIVEARLVPQSDSRVSDLTTTISEDRRSVELKFRLTAGPVFDRYRGWLLGQLILTMQPQN
ncbi:hypothetical protein XI03_12300 [Bradyrhizobium sp. CCBAU 65884]|nr:hypothetical protein [Bradyrhizobium sp. CCBAU 65884]